MDDRKKEAITWINSQLGAAKGHGNIPTNLKEITASIMQRSQTHEILLSDLDEIAKEFHCDPTSITAVVNLLTAAKPPFLSFTLRNEAGEILPNQTLPDLIRDKTLAEKTQVSWRQTNPMQDTLQLSANNYWQEIESLTLTASLKDTLKGIIHAHVCNTIPPSTPNTKIKELLNSPLRKIEITHHWENGNFKKKEYLTITVFLPQNPETHRQFAYLTNSYPNGTSVSLDHLQEKDLPA